MKLPIQYLFENSAKTDAMMSILISNQSLYRLRYRIRQKGALTPEYSSQCLTDYAFDATTSCAVNLIYFAQENIRDKEMKAIKLTNVVSRS